MKTIDEIREAVKQQDKIIEEFGKSEAGTLGDVIYKKWRVNEQAYEIAVTLLAEIDRLNQTIRAIEIIIEERK